MSATPQPVPAQPPSRSEIERKLSFRSTVAPRPVESPKKHRKPSHQPPPHTYPHAHPHALSGNESDSSIASSSIPGLASPNPGSGSATSNHPGSPLLTPAGTSVGGLSAIAERQFANLGGSAGAGPGGAGDEEIEGMGMVDLEDVEEEEEGEGESGSEVEAEGAGELERGMEGERVVKSGYLWKKQERRKAWKKRWFVLRTGKLAYYKDEKEYSLKRVLDLHQVHTVAPVTVKKHPHSFGIVVPKRTFFVKAASANDMEEWVHAINGVRRRLSERDEEERMKREKGEAHHPHHVHTHQARTASVPIPPRATPSGLHAIDTTSPTSTTVSYFGAGDRPIASPQPMSATPQTATSMFAGPSSPLDRDGGSKNLTSQCAKIAIPSRSPSEQSMHAVQSQPAAGYAGSPRRTSGAGGIGGQPRGISGTSAKREPSAGSISSAAEYFPRGITSPIVPAPASSEDEDDLDNEVPPPAALTAHAAAGGHAYPPEAPIDPNKVILSAYLMKRSKGRGTGRKMWRKRWFVLTSQGVTYTKSHMENRAPQFIPLSSVLDALEVDAPSPTDSDDSDRLSAHGHTHPGHPHGHPHGHPAHGQSPPVRQGFPIRGRLGSQEPSARKTPGTPGSHPPAPQAPSQPAHVEEQHIFRLITAKRTYVLCAPTEEDEIKWLAAFRALLNRERAGASGAVPGTPFSPQSGFAALPSNPPGSPTPGGAPSSSLSASAAAAGAGAGGRRLSVPFITQQPPTPASGPPALAPAALASGPTLGEVAPVAGAVGGTPSAGTAPGPPATSGAEAGVGHPPQHAPMNRGRSATYTAKSAVADVVRRFHPEKEKEV